MAEQVELDVVLNNDFSAPARDVGRSASRLESMLNRLGRSVGLRAGSFTKMTSSLRKMRGGFTTSSPAIARLDSALLGMMPAIMGVGRALLNIGKWAAIGFGVAVTAAAGFFSAAVFKAEMLRNRATLAFQAMAGSGTAMFERLKTLAMETGTTLNDAFEGMQAFMRAGFETSDAERWFKRMQDLSLIGVTSETRKRIVLAMSQIKGAGKLQGDELRQLQETGLDIGEVWTQIAKRMGISVEEAKKLKEAGKLGADVALQGIEAAVQKLTGGGEAGEAREKFLSESLGGSIERLKSLWSLAINEIAEAAKPAFKVINSILTDVTEAFQTSAVSEWADTMGTAFNLLASWLKVAWSIGKEVAAGFQAFMDDGNLETINALLEGMKVSLDIEDSAELWRSFGKVLANMVLGFVAITYVLVRLVTVLTQATEILKGWVDGFGSFGMTAGTNLVDGLVNGITGGLGRVQGAMSAISAAASNRFTGFWGIGSPSKLMQGFGMNLGQGLAIGAEASTPMAAAAVGGMGSPRGIASPTMDFSGIAGSLVSSGGGGGGGASVTVNINVSGAGANADEEWGRIAPRVRREIEVGLRTAGEL